MNFLTMMQRATAGAALSAPERALLKTLKGALYTALMAAAAAGLQMMTSGHFALTQSAVDALVGAGLMAGLVALEKAFTAQGDAKTAAAALASPPTTPAPTTIPLHQQSAPPAAIDGSAI